MDRTTVNTHFSISSPEFTKQKVHVGKQTLKRKRQNYRDLCVCVCVTYKNLFSIAFAATIPVALSDPLDVFFFPSILTASKHNSIYGGTAIPHQTQGSTFFMNCAGCTTTAAATAATATTTTLGL